MDEIKFSKETDFKETPIGKIPRDWDVRELGDESIADIIAGQSPPSSTYNKENRGLPFLQGKMEFGEMFPSPTTYCSEPIKVAKKDDILLSVRAPVGDVNIAPFECCIGRGLAAISPKVDKLNQLFLFHYLKLEGRRFEALSTGSTFKAIRRQEIERFLIPVPFLVEQRGVVGVLGVVDSVIAKAGEVIAKTERLKKCLMQELLTKGIGHKEYKQTPIGTTPKEWDIKSLSDVFKLTSGKPRPSEISDVITQKKSYPVYGGNGILGYADEFLLDKETIVIGRVGEYCGSIYKTHKFSWITDNALYATEILSDFDLEYLKYLLTFLNLNKFKKKMGQPLLTQTIIYSIDIPSPPLSEQHKIADILLAADKKLELERSQKARLERIKRGLMDVLLTGKVRVKVD